MCPIPQFDIFFNHFEMSQTSNKDKLLINFQTQMQASHYNNLIALWEPLIEQLTLFINHQRNRLGNPEVSSYLSINPQDDGSVLPVNVNLTLPIIMKLKDLIGVWKSNVEENPDIEDWQGATPEKGQTATKLERTTNVSPYIIRNYSGHAIEVHSYTKVYQFHQNSDQSDQQVNKTTILDGEMESVIYQTSYDNLFQQKFSSSDYYTVEKKKLRV